MWGWILAILFGFFGAALGASVAKTESAALALSGALYGAILGAMLGGTHDIVNGIKRVTREIRYLHEDEEEA
jgi:hypothetical protein